MSSIHTTTELTEQLVKDYASYAKVNWDDQVGVLFYFNICISLFVVRRRAILTISDEKLPRRHRGHADTIGGISIDRRDG